MEAIANGRYNNDGFAIKYDNYNNVIWAKNYGGTTESSINSNEDKVLFVKELANGNIAVAGQYTSNDFIIDGNHFKNKGQSQSTSGYGGGQSYSYSIYKPNVFVTYYSKDGTYINTYIESHFISDNITAFDTTPDGGVAFINRESGSSAFSSDKPYSIVK